MKHLTLAAALLAGTAFLAPSWAATVTYSATLKGASEVPPTTSQGTGTFQGSLDTASKTLTYTLTYSGLTGPATAAHIHGPAAVGANAGVMVPIKPPLASPVKGTATLTDAQIKSMDDGMTYANIHTKEHPAGEIRGQISKGG
ncbi:MAG: CHRD domain-containing protein [Acetobacteraceae bacterium]